MKINRMAAATLSVGSAAALTLGTAGAASASTLGHPKHHKPQHAVTQVTGSALMKALMPASQFGSGYQRVSYWNTGKRLWPSTPVSTVAGTDCKTFEAYPLFGYGNTADAGSTTAYSGDPGSLADNAPEIVTQEVAQFSSNGAASKFFAQAEARYNQCQSYSFTTNDKVLGQITQTVTSQSSTTSASIGGHAAFQIDQADELMFMSIGQSFADSLNTTFVVAGRNVYMVSWLTVQDVRTPNWMLNTLIGNAQKLYKG